MQKPALNIKQSISNFFTIGHQRTLDAKKNIVASFAIKGISITISLILIPLTIHYINPTQYGIWLTLSSIVAWFSFFDIGFGHGLRNKFAEAKALGDINKLKIYISTTYAVLIIIFGFIWILFFVLNFFLHWNRILNAPIEMSNELSILALIVFSFFCMQIVLKTINTVLIADQKPAIAASFDMLGQLIVLIIIYLLTKTTAGSLLYLGIVLGGIPIAILAISSLILYSNKYKHYSPSPKYVQFAYISEIMQLGYKFFVIQIASVILFTTSNILITQFYGPSVVTSYNIAYKYFSIALMIFTIILSPFWSAITDAYFKNELNWIKRVIQTLDRLSYVFVFCNIIMLLFVDKMISLWIGPSVKVSISVSIMMSLYFIVTLMSSVFNTFINGTGKIQIQFIASIVSILITIPLSFLFCKYYSFGPAGIIAAILCITFPCLILYRIQYHKIITGNAQGIWNK